MFLNKLFKPMKLDIGAICDSQSSLLCDLQDCRSAKLAVPRCLAAEEAEIDLDKAEKLTRETL